MGEALFTKTQRRVLGLLFGNPDRSYYANEIVRFAGAGIGAVQRELERLERRFDRARDVERFQPDFDLSGFQPGELQQFDGLLQLLGHDERLGELQGLSNL